MARPKRLKKNKSTNSSSISTYSYHVDGFNLCKKLFDEFLPDEKEIYGILLNNGVEELYSKDIAKIISRRLK